MIYRVNGYNSPATYYVSDQATLDALLTIDPTLNYVIGTKELAQQALEQTQQAALANEADRFSIMATVDSIHMAESVTVWGAVPDTLLENTVYQVFDEHTGTYTQVPTQLEAEALNEQKKQRFLQDSGLSQLIELETIE